MGDLVRWRMGAVGHANPKKFTGESGFREGDRGVFQTAGSKIEPHRGALAPLCLVRRPAIYAVARMWPVTDGTVELGSMHGVPRRLYARDHT